MPKKKAVESNTDIPKAEIARALTNSPELSTHSVKLGDKAFKLVDLPYDDYSDFITLLLPLVDTVIGTLSSANGAPVMAGIEGITVSDIFRTCTKQLPELTQIVLRQTEPNITLVEVKQLAGTPMKMASVVLAQIQHNRMIDEFADFFVQIAAMMKK